MLVAFAFMVLATSSVASVRHTVHDGVVTTEPVRVDPIDRSIWLN